MAQTDNFPILATATLAASRTVLNDGHSALKSNYSGSAEPSGIVEGQIWYDTDTNSLMIYDGTTSRTLFPDCEVSGGGVVFKDGSIAMTGALAMGTNKVTGLATGTAATDAITKTQSDSRNKLVAIPIGDLVSGGGTQTFFLYVSATAGTAVAVSLLVTNSPSSDVSNNWDITVDNVTDTLEIVTKNTNGADPSANTRYDLGTLANTTLGAGDVATIEFAPTGSAPQLDDVFVVFEFKQDTP